MLARSLVSAALLLALPACGGDEGSDPAKSDPRVTLVAPNGGEFASTQEVSWLARDDDEGDELTIALELLTLDASGQVVSTESIGDGLANVIGAEPATFSWDRSGVPDIDGEGALIPYRIRVTATDLAGNTGSDESDELFTLLDASALENLVWDDVQPIFVAHCGQCHREPAEEAGIEYFRLDKYDAADTEAPANSDLGVSDMTIPIVQRLLSQGSMPPFGNEPPSDLDKMRIESWINDGAPLTRE